MVTTVLWPILPELLVAWHQTDAAGGALFSAQFTGSVTAGLVSGLLVARFGDARTLAGGYARMAIGRLAIVGAATAGQWPARRSPEWAWAASSRRRTC